MDRALPRLAALLLVALVASLPLSAGSKSATRAHVTALRVELVEQQVVVAFRLANAFDENLQRRIESGLPTTLVFEFKLWRPRKWWFNRTVATGNLHVVAMYNAVTREYLINYKHNGNLIESRVVRNLDELRSAMTEFNQVPVFSLEQHVGDRLQLRVRAELGTRTRFFFIPTTVTTDWAESHKFVAARNGGPRPAGQ